MKSFWAGLILVGVCAIGSAQTGAARYKDPQGFSIVPPAGWKVQGGEETSRVAHDAAELTRKPTSITLIIYGPTVDGFRQNINVVVTQAATNRELNESDVEPFRNSMQRALSQSGMTVRIVSANTAKYCNRTCLKAETEIQTSSGTIHEMEVAVPAAGKAFVVTCSAMKPEFDPLRATFDTAVNSMQFDNDVPPSASALPPLVIDALIGGLCGGTVALIVVLYRRHSAQ